VAERDLCGICGDTTESGYGRYDHKLFPVLNKHFAMVCWTCLNLPRGSFALVPVPGHPELLTSPPLEGTFYTLEEMLADGFDKDRVKNSLKSVKKILGGRRAVSRKAPPDWRPGKDDPIIRITASAAPSTMVLPAPREARKALRNPIPVRELRYFLPITEWTGATSCQIELRQLLRKLA